MSGGQQGDVRGVEAGVGVWCGQGAPRQWISSIDLRVITDQDEKLFSLDLHRHSTVKFYKLDFLKSSCVYSFLLIPGTCPLPISSVIWAQITAVSQLILQPQSLAPMFLSILPPCPFYCVTLLGGQPTRDRI